MGQWSRCKRSNRVPVAKWYSHPLIGAGAPGLQLMAKSRGFTTSPSSPQLRLPKSANGRINTCFEKNRRIRVTMSSFLQDLSSHVQPLNDSFGPLNPYICIRERSGYWIIYEDWRRQWAWRKEQTDTTAPHDLLGSSLYQSTLGQPSVPLSNNDRMSLISYKTD